MDARIIKTKRKIKDALIKLLQEKPIHEVSVTEICKTAEVTRNSFYSHYSIPLDVLSEIIDELCETLFAKLRACDTSEEALIVACKYTKEHAVEYKTIMRNKGDRFILEKIIEHPMTNTIYNLEESNEITKEDISIIRDYMIYGSAALIMKWLENDMPVSPEVIGKTINSTSKRLLKGLLKD